MENPNIGVLSEEFLQEVANIPYKNLAIELLERLIKDDISAKCKTNIIQEKKFSDRLKSTLNKYHNRGIETAQVIEELIQMGKQLQVDFNYRLKLGLSVEETAFYDAIIENESAVRDMEDATLKLIAQELTEKLRNSLTVDWQKKESIRAKMRNLIRITLRRHKYPPDNQTLAMDLVMRQAEVLSDEWTRKYIN